MTELEGLRWQVLFLTVIAVLSFAGLVRRLREIRDEVRKISWHERWFEAFAKKCGHLDTMSWPPQVTIERYIDELRKERG